MVYLRKTEYYKSKFDQYKQNIKKSWQCINYLLGKSNSSKTSNFTITYDDVTLNEPIEISNLFNNHFANISHSLVKTLPPAYTHYSDYLNSANPSSMFFFPTSPSEISLIISQFTSKFSAGWDGIPTIALKQCSPKYGSRPQVGSPEIFVGSPYSQSFDKIL